MRRVLALVLGLIVCAGSSGLAIAQTGDGSSREEPLPIGSTFEMEDYEVTVLSVNPDAESLVLAENQFNDAAPAGDVMVMVRVEVTYNGTETGNPGFDLSFKVVGNQNRGYSQSDKNCGVVPEEEYSAGELFPDGTVQYNLCWMVSEEEAPTLVMYAEPLVSFDDDNRVWISLDPALAIGTPEA